MRTAWAIAVISAAAMLGGCGSVDKTCVVTAPTSGASAATGKQLINTDRSGVALQGYDPVAYFTDNKPVMGDAALTSTANGAVYRFASPEHKAMFDANPAKYEPAYGGYCGYAASINKVSPISPQWFQILDGRLVLQHNKGAWDEWVKDVPGNVVKADSNWPSLVEKNGFAGARLLNLDKDGVALGGYDVISYFEGGTPVKGAPDQESTYNGAKYWFASKAHRGIFESDPTKYEPSFGGFCGYAASINKLSPIDPTIYQIINGRLVLQHTPKAYELFNQDAAASLAKADRNWPGLVKRNCH